ncbi:MAG TPA: hypothetical protein VFZ74_07145 [Burkholderiales bacterium]
MDRIFGAVLALLVAVPAAAVDDPETVYGKLHRATLAGSVEEVLSYATAGRRKEMASLAGKEDAVRMMAMSLPKDYSVTKKDVDGRKAHLELRGVHDSGGPSRGNAELVKEKGAWKVDEWSWSAIAQAPVKDAPQPEPAKAPAEAAKPPAEAATAETVSTVPVPAPTLRRASADAAGCVIKPVMSDQDLRRCGATPPKYDN